MGHSLSSKPFPPTPRSSRRVIGAGIISRDQAQLRTVDLGVLKSTELLELPIPSRSPRLSPRELTIPGVASYIESTYLGVEEALAIVDRDNLYSCIRFPARIISYLGCLFLTLHEFW